MWNYALQHPYLFALLSLLVPSVWLLGIAIVTRELGQLIKNVRTQKSSFLDLMAEALKKQAKAGAE